MANGHISCAQLIVFIYYVYIFLIQNIKAKDDAGESVPDSKSDNDAVKKFMAAVLPAYDTEKVYVSDMKKLFTWYHTLKPVIDFSKLGVEEEAAEE